MTTNAERFPEYAKLLEVVVLNLRMRIRYGEEVSNLEVHDLMDAIHNIPQLLLACDPSNWKDGCCRPKLRSRANLKLKNVYRRH